MALRMGRGRQDPVLQQRETLASIVRTMTMHTHVLGTDLPHRYVCVSTLIIYLCNESKLRLMPCAFAHSAAAAAVPRRGPARAGLAVSDPNGRPVTHSTQRCTLHHTKAWRRCLHAPELTPGMGAGFTEAIRVPPHRARTPCALLPQRTRIRGTRHQ